MHENIVIFIQFAHLNSTLFTFYFLKIYSSATLIIISKTVLHKIDKKMRKRSKNSVCLDENTLLLLVADLY